MQHSVVAVANSTTFIQIRCTVFIYMHLFILLIIVLW